MTKRELAFLTALLRQPTAPFRETQVIDFAARALRRHRVPFFADPIGNVVIGCASRSDYARLVAARTREPLRLYIAHMDHPGFHGDRWLPNHRLRVRWHGGGPTRHLVGAPVWLADTNGQTYRGQMRSARLARNGRSIETAEVRLEPDPATPRAADSLYGGFSFRAPVWRSGRRLYTKAADDLVGVYAILRLAIEQARRGGGLPFLGLLTRAEEVGFVGAIGHFELGWLSTARRPLICISLETSRTLANAIIGKGPVVRLGDRRTVFDPNAINVLSQLAQRLLPDRHQRRIMDGGTCEATAATVYGWPAIGISIPLGNYHNQGLEGGPGCRGRNGPAPEFVHLDDIEGMIALCRGLLQRSLPWDAPWKAERTLYKDRLKAYRSLL
jgi:putative aminopeptidase FrvX